MNDINKIPSFNESVIAISNLFLDFINNDTALLFFLQDNSNDNCSLQGNVPLNNMVDKSDVLVDKYI